MLGQKEQGLSAQPASLRCLPLGSKLFQGIATMTYTRSHTRPSQKDLGCVVYPLYNKSLVDRLAPSLLPGPSPRQNLPSLHGVAGGGRRGGMVEGGGGRRNHSLCVAGRGVG
jgi:hypothetical protein